MPAFEWLVGPQMFVVLFSSHINQDTTTISQRYKTAPQIVINLPQQQCCSCQYKNYEWRPDSLKAYVRNA